MTPTLIFDIETIPDISTGKRINPNLAELSDEDVHNAMVAMRQAEAGTDFMRLPLHKIACLSMLWVDEHHIKLKSFSLNEMSEKQILSTFFNIFEQGQSSYNLPNIVSWNGSGFDIPVMLYRAMHHKLSAPAFMKEDGDMKYNNYLSRYHTRHLDLMDKMTLYSGFTRQPLDLVSGLCGFAGKMDIDGSMVVDLVKSNDWNSLTTYCESDVLNTWLVYLRWQLLSGHISEEMVDQAQLNTRQYVESLIDESGKRRHAGFLDGWK